MKPIKQILLANQAWAAELTEESPEFFVRQVVGQKPQFLWIGCSDSRVSPEQMTQSQPGGMFIHRNVANLVQEGDLNLLSVIQYAVDVLEIPNIIICGHHGCGGVKAALHGGTEGPVHQWLANARQVRHDHADELDAMADDHVRVDRLVELNVRDQLLHLARVKTVCDAFAAGKDLTLHGWVYDIRDGRLKPLLVIDRATKIDEVGLPKPVLVQSDAPPVETPMPIDDALTVTVRAP